MMGGKGGAERPEHRKGLKRLQQVKTWQLVLLLVLVLFVSATFLRLNNIGMLQRREAVLQADSNGDIAAVHDRLYDLQRYSSSKMNASTGQIYLQTSYDNAAAAAKKAAEEAANSGGENIYKKIEEEVCGPQARANGWRWPDPRYIACQRAELEKYPAASGGSGQVSLPNKSLFVHSFYSPLWSPDFAGFSVLFCMLITLVIVGRMIGVLVLRVLLRKHYKNA